MTDTPRPDANGGAGPEPATVSVEDVSLSFGDLSVLEAVSLSVEPGEFVGFVGPNGAGKTSLLRSISGALEPSAGTVEISDTNVHDVSSRRSSRLVAVVPQDTSLSFSFPVRDVVEMGRHPHRSRFSPPSDDDRAAVERALERTRTAELADRPIDEVSGGQRQRVVLARAIAQETPVLLLDEPTASLDINHQIETLEVVRELVADGRTVVAAIHDLDLAARYCDRLVLLADGTVHTVGPPSAVLTTETLAETFEANAAVTPNPVTGTATVTALPHGTSDGAESGRAEPGEATDGGRTPSAHVVGTGSTAAGVLTRLERAGVDVSIGPIPGGDVADETARRLEVDRIAVEPFARPSASDRAALDERVRGADVTVVADLAVGATEDGRRLLESIETAERLVFVERRPPEERIDGNDVRRRYEDCRERAVEATPESVLEAVRATLRRRSET
ncbi:heme ABC transporter ATP-binding protein [Natrarchaeobius oligotrophus]|uniref:Cobalamin import ATP-binding protein BtuD n=1 Tax=Natrarchaeobius chitinivorans TaxID=1679083 RepID=A0A3N6NF59_NATCH|nr:heme ABC transporter ATP-binding protein [Natrarchaeobius chitinivorans]RQG97582.1 heme ABC transporter ATP-binding protein [Natrarchaeobius chitinivorans]